MGNMLCDLQDVRFFLYDLLKVQELCQAERYRDHSRETFEMTINTAEKLAVNDFMPANESGDKIGCVWADGRVRVPSVYHEPYRKLAEGGWFCAQEDYEVGGQNVPHVIDYVCKMLFFAANHSLAGYYGLTHSAAKVIEVFGTEDQKRKYMFPLYEGRFGGTMCLTESQAGSDVGAVRSKAFRNEDGTFSITGSKIFITGGETDLNENIVHVVLARIEGDPGGTKGLSCFIVPKIRVNDDGTLGEDNDVACPGIEHKMGMRGSSTSVLAFGDNGNCIGELLGQERRGIVTMFNMMNEQRLLVGMQGIAQGNTAYLHALNFARERKQGMARGNKGFDQDPIMVHADVRRNLLWMKCYTEGIRALILYAVSCMDRIYATDDQREKTYWNDILEVLTPICKAFGSEKGFEICIQAIQVLGGYGYCTEYRVEQFARDCKIASIYEGTNGIQALDLINRKIGLRNGRAYRTVLSLMKETIGEALEWNELIPYATDLRCYVGMLEDVTEKIQTMKTAGQGELIESWAAAYLEIWGDILLGWMFLWEARVARERLAETQRQFPVHNSDTPGYSSSFYTGKIITAKYYLGTLMPTVAGKFEVIKRNETVFLDMKESYFND